MIAVPKNPRPHQPEPLKQQLINQIAVGAVIPANELRELIKLETAHLKNSEENPAASGSSHAVWSKDGKILESLPLTATAGAKAWFAKRAKS